MKRAYRTALVLIAVAALAFASLGNLTHAHDASSSERCEVCLHQLPAAVDAQAATIEATAPSQQSHDWNRFVRASLQRVGADPIRGPPASLS